MLQLLCLLRISYQGSVLRQVELADLQETAMHGEAAQGGQHLVIGQRVEHQVNTAPLRLLQDELLEAAVAGVTNVVICQLEIQQKYYNSLPLTFFVKTYLLGLWISQHILQKFANIFLKIERIIKQRVNTGVKLHLS